LELVEAFSFGGSSLGVVLAFDWGGAFASDFVEVLAFDLVGIVLCFLDYVLDHCRFSFVLLLVDYFFEGSW